MRLIFLKIFCAKLLPKISWCLQNFLTMEFYRKICRKCYWNNIYEKEHSVLKNTLLILVSILPLMFLSFFYQPTDPANSNKTSSALRSIKLFLLLRLKFGAMLDSFSDKVLSLPSFFSGLGDTRLSGKDLFVTYSVLRI